MHPHRLGRLPWRPWLKKAGGLGASSTVNAPITINGPASEHGNLSGILAEHARETARQVERVLQIEAEQAAVV
jgi:hypothetical protein